MTHPVRSIENLMAWLDARRREAYKDPAREGEADYLSAALALIELSQPEPLPAPPDIIPTEKEIAYGREMAEGCIKRGYKVDELADIFTTIVAGERTLRERALTAVRQRPGEDPV